MCDAVPASLRSTYAPLAAPPTRERPLHVVLACTGSVASVKVPLIVRRLLGLRRNSFQVKRKDIVIEANIRELPL